MFCGHCGQKVKDDVIFCPVCGTRLKPATPPSQPPRPPKPPHPPKPPIGRILKIIAVCLSVTLLVGLAFAFLPKNSGYIKIKHDIWYFDQKDKGGGTHSFIMVDGEQVGKTVDGKIVGFSDSLDGSVGICLTEESNLYVVTPEKLTLVAGDVTNAALSANGSAVVYCTGARIATVYSVLNGEKMKVADNAVGGLAISPNGKSVLYTALRDPQNPSEESSLFFYNYTRNKKMKIGNNAEPIGLSNAGRQIYYVDTAKSSLYVTDTAGNQKKLAVNVDLSDSLKFNSKMTQVVFYSENKWYVSVKGSEKQEMGGIIPDALSFVYAPYNESRSFIKHTVHGVEGIFIARFNRLNDLYYVGWGNVGYLDKGWNSRVISTKTSTSYLSKGAKRLFYCEDGTLYIVEEEKSFEPVSVPTKGKIKSYAVTHNGKAVYYIDQADTLWYQKISGKPKRIAEDVQTVDITHDDYALFCIDDSIFGCKNGKGKKLLVEDGVVRNVKQNVTLLRVQNKNTEGTYDIYAANRGLDFTKIAEAVS